MALGLTRGRVKTTSHQYSYGGAQPTKKKLPVIVLSVLIVVLIIGALIVTVSHPPLIESGWVGICVHKLSEDDASLVKDSGAGWIRIDVSPTLASSVGNAKAFNLSVLGILGSWMFNNGTIFTLEDWRSNVTYYVSQYADYVDAWEIWNEPANSNPNWALLGLDVSGQENMSRVVGFYFSMVQVASPIIRQYDPSAEIVLFGGLNLWSGGAPNFGLDMEFARQLADTNITQYGDVISVHAYPWGETNVSRVLEKYDESLADYRGLFPSLELWVTETGRSVAEAGGVEEQAQYLRDALPYFEEKVERLFWYSLLDNEWEEKCFGLVVDGTPRAAYYAMQQLTGK